MNFVNSKLEKFKHDIKEKKVAVIGIGISNIPAIKYLSKLGANITALDKNVLLKEKFPELETTGVKFVLGQNYLDNLNNYDYILRSPGVKPFFEQIENAVKNGVKLTSEIELLMELAPCKIIGVTGTEGKTTTTTIISKILKESGYNIWIGGNIGTPIFSKIEEIKPDDIVILELSSFQLMTMKVSPNISIITNIYPDHLNYHRSLDEYIDAKANIFLHQKKGDILVLNDDDEKTERFLKNVKDKGIENTIRYFSVKKGINNGTFIKNKYIVSNVNSSESQEQKIVKTSDVKLIGIHNLANISAAISSIIDMCDINSIKKAISEFTGVEHRLEMFRILNGVKWYNDSIGTSPASTIAGLKSFDSKIIQIAGGSDKNIPYDEVGKYILEKVKTLLLVGDTSEKIKNAVLNEAQKQNLKPDQYCDIHIFDELSQCVDYAYKIAKPGDNVVLSPASASFDRYKNFEERGNYFKSLVNKLK